MSVTINY